MLALITGASSGIGRDMARYLNKLGYDIIMTARSEDKLKELKDELDSKKNGKVDVIISDLSKEEECIKLYNEVKAKYKNIDLLVNNAGFGLFGEFNKDNWKGENLLGKILTRVRNELFQSMYEE